MDQEAVVLAQIKDFVKERLQNEGTGHDFDHAKRVAHWCEALAKEYQVDRELLLAGAYLHDTIDDKVTADVSKATTEVAAFLRSLGFQTARVNQLLTMIAQISFSKELAEGRQPLSIEGQILQDADRLDALGAIGIMRAAYFGGHFGEPIYDKTIPVQIYHDKASYRKKSTVVNHFHEKLFLLPAKMHTPTAKIEAERRVKLMKEFLKEFHWEWDF